MFTRHLQRTIRRQPPMRMMLARPTMNMTTGTKKSYLASEGLTDDVVTDLQGDYTQAPIISLEEFYSTTDNFRLTDEEALEYMTFSARMALVSFKDDEEMLSFKGDFQAALAFIQKLDEVDVKGVEPMGNVFEFYGGNETKMRTEEDFIREGDDQTKGSDFNSELRKLNKHMIDNYVVLPKPRTPNPDSE